MQLPDGVRRSPLHDGGGDVDVAVSPTVSVVIMAFNEVSTLDVVANEIVQVLYRARVRHEIIIVDDGSTDGTGPVADRLAQQVATIRVIHHRDNSGLGAVYRTGFEAAKHDCVTFFPADGQFPASIIPEFLETIRQHDLVLGYLPVREELWTSKALSAGERLLYRCLFGPLPKFQGVMMVRRSVLARAHLRSRGRGWGILMELVVKVGRGPYRVVSIPTAYRRRMSGRSKVNNVRTVLANLREMIALRRIV